MSGLVKLFYFKAFPFYLSIAMTFFCCLIQQLELEFTLLPLTEPLLKSRVNLQVQSAGSGPSKLCSAQCVQKEEQRK